jgi:aspartate kinase
MSLLVQKYGGTSVDGPERIRAVARRVAAARAAGHDTVVVVSAMGQSTDELIALAHQVSAQPRARELDMLLTAGERVSMALLAMALHDLDVPAISFTGSQSGILTDGAHSAARIVDVKPERIRAALGEGRVVIVAGFPGRRSAHQGDHHARPRRLRHDGGRSRSRARRRRRALRDLHGRRGGC